MQHSTIETRSATPIETRDDDDPIAEAVEAVNELRSNFTEFRTATEERTSALDDLNQRLEAIETAVQRPGATDTRTDESDVEHRALANYLRGGINALEDATERRALNVGTNSAGGYVVAPEYSRNIIEGLTELSPMRALSSVLTIGTNEIYLPKMTTPLDGTWVTETGQRQESQPVFDQQKIEVFEHAVIVPMSTQLVEDSMIDLSGYVSRQIGKRFARAESLAFTVGDGNGKPTGFLDDPTDFDQVEANQDGSDIVAKLIELFYALPQDYAQRATWQMTRKTMGIVRAAADNTDKGNLWSDSLADGTPPRFLGAPVRENPHMDELASAESPAVDTFPVALGDWESAYTIVDRVNVELMGDPYTGADNGIWKLRARRRFGGAVTLAEAIVLLNGAAA